MVPALAKGHGITAHHIRQADTLCKAQKVAEGNAVDNFVGGKPIDLLGKDMFQPGVIVREDLPLSLIHI